MASTQFSTLHDADDDDTRLVERFELDMPSEADRRRNSSVVTRVRNAVVTSPRLQCGLIAGLVVFIVVVVTAATIIFPHDSSNGDDQGELTVLIVGDWGRRGSHNQTLVAAQMAATAEKVNPDFIISVGDNFYSWGVQNVSDPQFQESWQDVYNMGPLTSTKWWVALGNHDWRGVPGAEIDFSALDDRWTMPSHYFRFKDSFAGGCAAFVVADTSPFVYTTPNAKMPALSQADPDAQLAWLDTAFSSARAECDWVFAIGHHPIYSAGDHGDHPGLLAKFLPLFQKHGVASYIAGHDHDLQHIQMQGFNYVVSGAGSDVRGYFVWDHPGLQYGSTDPGFVQLTVRATTATYDYIGTDGKVEYSFSQPLPGTRRLRQ